MQALMHKVLARTLSEPLKNAENPGLYAILHRNWMHKLSQFVTIILDLAGAKKYSNGKENRSPAGAFGEGGSYL